jgi:hypothetical protein
MIVIYDRKTFIVQATGAAACIRGDKKGKHKHICQAFFFLVLNPVPAAVRFELLNLGLLVNFCTTVLSLLAKLHKTWPGFIEIVVYT